MSPSIRKSASSMAPILAALLLAGCGDGGASDAPPSSAPDAAATPQSPADAPPYQAAATRDDVIAALRCHAVLSSAMASRIVVGGEGSAVVGIREQTRWFAEAQRRADSAGLNKDEFRTLMAETRAPMITEAQQAENRPLLEQCLAETPPLP